MIDSLTLAPAWSSVGWTMLHFLWAGAAVWVVAAVLRLTTVRAPPQVRYAVALVSLLAIAATAPAVAIWSYTEISSQSAASPGTRPAMPLAPSAVLTILVPGDGQFDLADGINTHLVPWLPGVWLTGTSLGLLFTALGTWGTFRLRRYVHIDPRHPAFRRCEQLRQTMDIARTVAVAVSDRVATPLLVGIVRPLVVLPAAAMTGWTPRQLEMILLHELAHVARRDNLVNFAQRVIESLLFFHPAVWIVSGWVRREREHCCDRFVLARTERPLEYAQLLVKLAEQQSAGPVLVSAFGRHHIHSRLRHILGLNREVAPMSATRLVPGIVVLGLLLIFAVVPDAAMSGLADEPPKAPADALAQAPDDTAAPQQDVPSQPDPKVPDAPPPVDVIFTLRPGETLVVPGQEVANGRSWGPEQAAGEPNTNDAGDIPTAWASLTPDEQTEWLLCEYANAVMPRAVVIHETYNPGAVVKVSLFDPDGQEVEVWSGMDPTPRDQPRGISVIPIKAKFQTNRVKVYLDSPAVSGWNEIDAVGLRDAEGNTQWAAKVEASSTYATQSAPPMVVLTQQQVQRFMQLEIEVNNLKEELQKMKQLEQDVKELKRLLQQRGRE